MTHSSSKGPLHVCLAGRRFLWQFWVHRQRKKRGNHPCCDRCKWSFSSLINSEVWLAYQKEKWSLNRKARFVYSDGWKTSCRRAHWKMVLAMHSIEWYSACLVPVVVWKVRRCYVKARWHKYPAQWEHQISPSSLWQVVKDVGAVDSAVYRCSKGNFLPKELRYGHFAPWGLGHSLIRLSRTLELQGKYVPLVDSRPFGTC